VTDYEREDDGADPKRAVLHELRTTAAVPGAVATVLPPHADFHRVWNPSQDEQAMSIHTYGRDIRRFHTVDLATGELQVVEAQYLTVPSPRAV
jgi:hypothetical protein